MKNILGIILIITFFYSNLCLSQNKLELKFDLYEMELIVNDKIVDHNDVGYDCTLNYNYRDKDYMFLYTYIVNNKKSSIPFEFVKTKNNVNYFRISKHFDRKTRFIVRDSIYSKNKIEFINTVTEENGDIVSLIYRFSR